MADVMQVPSLANDPGFLLEAGCVRCAAVPALYRHELDVCAELHQDDLHVVAASSGGLEGKSSAFFTRRTNTFPSYTQPFIAQDRRQRRQRTQFRR